jgi:hypothetical protein
LFFCFIDFNSFVFVFDVNVVVSVLIVGQSASIASTFNISAINRERNNIIG